MPTPPASNVPFKCYAEGWETTTDKRQRRGQGWRTRYKYMGMVLVLEDKENNELRRVVGACWHSDRKEVNAGWALETVLAGSHTERELYHVLSVCDNTGSGSDDDGGGGQGDVPPHYDLFDSVKPEHNEHRP